MVQPWRVESSESMVPPSVATGLRAFAARRIRNWAAAEDVSQEALRIGVEALAAGRIPSPAALPGFLFRTAANLCLHHGRSAARESRALQRLASRGAERTGEGGDAFDTLLSAERRARLLRALGRLEHAERRLLQMTYRDELSSQEIGRRLGITCGAVRARRHRALRRLAALLAGTAPPRPRILRILPLALLALVAFLGGASGSAQEVREFSAPQPCDIAEGPDGAMWFAEGPFRKIGRIDGTGAVTEFQIGKDTFSVARGLDGNLWFTTPAALGRMTPRGELTWHPVAHATQVVPSPDGNLWFTTWRSDGATSIGRVTPGGAVTEFPLSAGSPTYDSAWDPCPDTRVIAAALDGGAWYARPCAGKLGRVTASGTVVEFALPGPRSPRRIAVGPDGNLWFTESLPAVGRLSPSGDLAEFPLSGGAHGIVAGIDGNLWAAGRGTL
ncbi:MAG TPA: sigma-70 family RNA polymerase sigma factor, partial [Thermoanaerobaculia bacterium]|nr:sigma-70 family RNA polymerase sigma factor [Thermoanaerobaculia bacterium]